MLDFYKKAVITIALLAVISAGMVVWGLNRTILYHSLLPHAQSQFAWRTVTETDANQGGASTIAVRESSFDLEFSAFISTQAEYPAASVSMEFVDETGSLRFVDLSRYHQLAYRIKCSTGNVLALTVFTFDPSFSKRDEYITYRAPSGFLSCDRGWAEGVVDLTRLEIPQWWLEAFELKLSMNEYSLKQVAKLAVGSTFQSPREQAWDVRFNRLELIGHDWRYAYGIAVLLLFIWAFAVVALARAYTGALTRELRSKMQRDRPLVAYQQLSVQPQQDKSAEAILRYMATEYANEDINLEAVVKAVGLSRNKVNEILKSELGYTFTGYLNKLRLTEAARLLAQTPDTSISEIAYSVGYKHISYFNKLFKEEYGCSPKMFRNVSDKPGAD